MLQKLGRKVPQSVNTGRRVIVLAFCNFPYVPLSMYQVSFNYLQYFRDMLWTSLLLKQIRKEINSLNTGDRLIVLAFLDFPYNPLSVFRVSFHSLLNF